MSDYSIRELKDLLEALKAVNTVKTDDDLQGLHEAKARVAQELIRRANQ